MALLTGCCLASAAIAQDTTVAPPGSVRARFGFAVDLRGDLLLVGSPGADDAGIDAGAAYLYERSRDGWRRIAAAYAPADLRARNFSGSVALGAGLVAVGDPSATQPSEGAGAVVGYRTGRGVLGALPTLLGPEDEGIGIGYGSRVAFGGADRLLVGATGMPSVGRARLGAVLVYQLAGDQWRLEQRIDPPGAVPTARFGASLAIDGDSLVVGAIDTRPGAGAAYSYRRREDRWRLAGRVDTAPAAGHVGQSVALAGDVLVVGDPGGPGGTYPGAVHVYRRQATDEPWQYRHTIDSPTPEPGSLFGNTLALEAELLFIGAPHEDAMGLDSGAVHVYRVPVDGPPERLRRLAVPTRFGGDRFGAALSLDGGRLAVGAPGRDGEMGAVYVFPVDEQLQPTDIVYGSVAHPDGGLSAPAVNALSADSDGRALLGTYRGGLDVFDGTRITAHPHAPGDPTSLSHDGVLALLTDADGVTWVGTEDGLNRYEPSTGAFARIALQTAPGEQPVVAIHQDARGALWTGTRGRLFRRMPGEAAFREFLPFRGPPDALRETYVSGIQSSSDGRIWVLAKHLLENHASLYSVDPGSGTVERYPVAAEWEQVGPLLIDSADRVWLKGPSSVALPTVPGAIVEPREPPLPESHWAMLESADGTVWLGTQTGLYRAPPGASRVRLERIAPFLPPRRPWDWVRSLYEARPGLLLVGTDAGLFSAMTPGGSSAAAATPRLSVRAVQVSGAEGTRQVASHGLEVLRIEPSDASFAVELATVDLLRAGERRYRYRLVDFDPGWIDAGSRGFASYTNVPPGEYTLEVESRPLAGGSASRLALPVSVAPAFWQTGLFRGGLALLITVAAGGVLEVRRRQRREVERLRLRIASDLHDDLSTNLSAIALLGERIGGGQSGTVDSQDAADRIAATARGMADDLRDLVWHLDPAHDSVEELLAKMRHVAETLLEDRCDFEPHAERALGRLTMQQRRELLLVFKELVHNAARHARAERVEIRLDEIERRLRLRVEDDGIGFDPSAVAGGHGLRSVRARAARMRAELTVDSAPGAGTRCCLQMNV